MSSIESVLSEMHGLISNGSATKEEIAKAEGALGVIFAKDYNEYLARFGCASFIGHELTGIIESQRLNVIAATMRNRSLYGSLPRDWYVIEEANLDDIVIWQAPDQKIYQTAMNKSPVKIAENLAEYIQMN